MDLSACGLSEAFVFLRMVIAVTYGLDAKRLHLRCLCSLERANVYYERHKRISQIASGHLFLQKLFETVRSRGLDVASGRDDAVGLAIGQADFLKTLSGDDLRGSCQKGSFHSAKLKISVGA
ncbi:hypothetical protein N9X60_05205 [Paracoccaceae bacterium]|nr:hypothetical protein [Paracoccaceae bacterium]